MKLGIKNPAPMGLHQKKWGDFHFGQSLQWALEARGVEVVQHYWPDWDKEDDESEILVLHGKRHYMPPSNRTSVLWILSHPARITREELDAYSMIYAASETHLPLLKSMTSTPVELMRQCTDIRRFSPPDKTLDEQVASREGTVFVANSRGTRRDMVLWAVENKVPVRLIGRHWEQVGLSEFVEQEYIDNDKLAAVYRGARIGLNDHWADMRHFGIINNRVFDCLACGLPVISDGFPELREVFGDDLLYAHNSAEFVAALKTCQERYPEILEKTNRAWERLGSTHTFDARAEQILAQIKTPVERRARKYLDVSAEDLIRVEASIRENVSQQLQRGRDLETRMNAIERGASVSAVRSGQPFEDLRTQLNACNGDIKALNEYASELEARYRRVLTSRTWRLMAPVRALIGWLRAMTGRKPTRNYTPERPRLRSKL